MDGAKATPPSYMRPTSSQGQRERDVEKHDYKDVKSSAAKVAAALMVEEKRKEASATAFQKAVLGLRSGRRSVDEEPAALAAGLAAVQEAHEAQAAQRAHVEAQTQDAKVPEGGVNMAAVLAKERLGHLATALSAAGVRTIEDIALADEAFLNAAGGELAALGADDNAVLQAFRRRIKAALSLFKNIDSDRDGILTVGEVEDFMVDTAPSIVHRLARLFALLDADDDGRVTRAEFCQGFADWEGEMARPPTPLQHKAAKSAGSRLRGRRSRSERGSGSGECGLGATSPSERGLGATSPDSALGATSPSSDGGFSPPHPSPLPQMRRVGYSGDESIEELVVLLASRDASAADKELAARHLGYVSHVDGEAVDARIVAAGAVPPLVALLGNGPAGAAEQAAATLRNLLSGSEERKEAVLSAGALPALVAMLGNARRPGAFEQAAAALAGLCAGSADRKAAAAAAGAPAALVQALSVHLNLSAQCQCVGALRNMANGGAGCADAVAESGGVAVLEGVLSSVASPHQARAHAAVALGSLARSGGRAARAALEQSHVRQFLESRAAEGLAEATSALRHFNF